MEHYQTVLARETGNYHPELNEYYKNLKFMAEDGATIQVLRAYLPPNLVALAESNIAAEREREKKVVKNG